jgi:small-conductance mechanosensitive channel
MSKEAPLKSVEHWFAHRDWSDAGVHVASAIAIVAGAFLLSRLMRVGFDKLRDRFAASAPVIYIVEQLGIYLVLVVGVLVGISTLGVDLGSLTVFGGAVGVGLGLGLQGVVKEFVSGLVLIFDPTIQVGDFIEVEDGIRGEVVEIGPRATRLRTNDDLNIVIPNSTLIQTRVTNWTYNAASRRIHVPFSVASESDIAQVRDVVLAAATALPFTLPGDDVRKNQVWLTGFSGDKLDFDLVVWPTLESSRHPRTMHAAYTWAIYEGLSAADIQAADPRMDVRLSGIADLGAGETKAPSRRRGVAGRGRKRADLPAPNDAANAMFEDADRNRRQRDEKPRRHEPPDSQA